MTTIEERAKRICTNSFCNKLHKPICKTCIWRRNRELTELQCSVPEYKDAIESVYDSAICQLLLQREELTQWHAPEEYLPKFNHDVLVKYYLNGKYAYAVANLKNDISEGYFWLISPIDIVLRHSSIIGWRPIYE